MKKTKKAPVKSKLKAKPVKKVKAPKNKRTYNIQKRQEKTQSVSKAVIESLVELLVARRGGDVAFAEIAAKSKVPLRTIFRLFKDKQALHAAMDQYLFQYLQTTMSELSQHDFLGFARNTFGSFDKEKRPTKTNAETTINRETFPASTFMVSIKDYKRPVRLTIVMENYFLVSANIAPS